MSVILETSIGDLTVDLYTDERPRCCMNFLKLCKMKYYNFSLFHSVQQNLVAQTGDPTATGRGGESIYSFVYGEQARFFEMEIVPRILHTKKGLLSMANNGSGMHGSQFFITLADSVDYLNNKHTVFGEVAEGLDIVDKLNNAFCDDGNRPHQDIRIYHTVILDDPYDDPDGLVIPSKSPPPTQEMLDSDRIPCDADIDDEQGMTNEQLTEMAAEREAKANTQILEMVGDLPDQELAPPENVLFVCKLNPVTTSDDLEIIFSRFGTVVSCEVIKDQKTGESLQYAFVEFERQPDCEMAYFKMDNVLIDDRRIHVDFSQSVSKLKWKGKGKGVEIMNDGDGPKYVLKDQQRKSDGYDLVYAHEDFDEDVSQKDKSHKKHKKSKREDSQERSKNNHRNNDRNNRRDQEMEERRRDKYDERDKERHKDRRDKCDDRGKQRNIESEDRYHEKDRQRNAERRGKYEEKDRQRNTERSEKYSERGRERRERSRERDDRRHHNEENTKRRNESHRERKSRYSDYSDNEDERYGSRNQRMEDGSSKPKKAKSSRRESHSDDDKQRDKRRHKKHKSEKKRGHYSDSESSSQEESGRRHKYDSDEEFRRKDKKKKRKA